jgi:hypothetical protein
MLWCPSSRDKTGGFDWIMRISMEHMGPCPPQIGVNRHQSLHRFCNSLWPPTDSTSLLYLLSLARGVRTGFTNCGWTYSNAGVNHLNMMEAADFSYAAVGIDTK